MKQLIARLRRWDRATAERRAYDDEQRCAWVIGHARCIRPAEHEGVCITESSTRYKDGPWRIRQHRWFGANYDTGAGHGTS